MKPIINRYSLALLTLTGSLALADDTEIYLSTNTEIGGDYAKPNILFVMDTSGSMGDNIAIEVPPDTDSPFYDPDTDYGDSDDSLIYVYDTDFEYQGVTITQDQNVCQSMTDYFADNPNSPYFQDQAYQWQTETTTQTITETNVVCEDVVTGGDPITETDSNDVGDSIFSTVDYGPYAVAEGQDFVASVRVNGNDEVRLYVKFGSAPSAFSYDCRRSDLRNETGTCDLTVPNGETQAYVSVSGNDFTFWGGGDNDFDYEVTYGGGSTGQVCETITTTTDIEVTEANWSDNLEINASDEWVLECQNDEPDWVGGGRRGGGYWSGGHGIDAASDDKWVRNCGSNDCAEPRYTNDYGDRISWGGMEVHAFLPANYHDYIQAFGPPEDLGAYPTGDVSSTCRYEDEGYEFVDDGTVYRCTEKRGLMQDSTVNLINSLVGVNLGLARFNGSDGGYILEDIKDVDVAANKTSLIDTVEDVPASGSTPLAETLWETMRYFRGNSQDYGNNYGTATDPDALRGLSDLVNPTWYESPIENACQVNSIIYLTDGEPTSDSGRDSQISSLTGNSCSSSSYADEADDTCLDELAEYMNTHDMADGITGTQTVRTYTIGFDIDLELLNATAEKGGGEYFTVSNAFQLSSAFTNILVDVLSDSSTFVAPAVSVNAFNQLQNRNELYYAVFKPDNSPRWSGNIKKYRISSDGTVTDVNGSDAIDPNTGYFADNAQSYWSPEVDGKVVELGGIGSQMPDNRVVYTYTGSNPSNVTLASSADYRLATSNALVTNEMLGLDPGASSTLRNNIILWGAGYDLTDDDSDGRTNDANMFVGDPLHSRPVVITYGGTEQNPDDLLIASTNLGFIHAVNPSTGVEQWSFIPGELLDNLQIYRDGNTEDPKAYGLDGELTTWYKESLLDSDQDIEAGDGDFVKIYLGMRRGGRNYFALDITNKTSPKIMWKINGGSGVFHDLGQSWSKMIKAKVAWDCDGDGTNCGVRDVLFFSGGYDPRHDFETDITTGDLGNAIYMVDANTGELLWSAGNNSDGRTVRTHNLGLDMDNAIPASPELIDVNADGLADILYAVDIAGHVWRIDMNAETESASDFATGGEVYDLTESGEFRRFYNQPDLVLTAERGQPAHINVIFGSGYRAHPRDTAQDDRIYVLFDDNVFSAPTNGDGDIAYTTIDGTSLYNAGGEDIADKSVNAPNGYYISLTGNGEKILGSSVTIQNRVIMSSYMPQGVTAAGSCSGGQLGTGRTYILNLSTGENEYIELKQEGIPAEAAVVAVPDTVVCVGTECFAEEDLHDVLPESVSDLLAPALQGYTGAKRTYWREESTQ